MTRPYYEALGKACDEIVRCNSCRALVTSNVIALLGMCPCGSTKVTEVRTLTEEEYNKILSGEIDFPQRAEFLAEFGAVTMPGDRADG